MNNIQSILYSSSVVLVASTVQGTVGFGFALIAVPLLSLLLPMKVVVPMIVCYSLVTNLMIVTTTINYVNLKRISVMIISGLIGIPIGVYGLKNLNPEILKGIIGIIIVITAIFMMKGYKIHFKRENLSFGITGFISGVLNGCLSMSGPPVVLFLSNQGYDKNEFRANLTFYAIITNIMAIMAYILNKLLTKDMVGILGINVITLLLGSYLGITISGKIKSNHFNKIIHFLLVIIGIVTVFKAIIY